MQPNEQVTENKKVLIAEDETMVRELLSSYLERRGMRVVAVPNGREALEKFRKEHFDLVLSDVKMPEITGLQLLVAIKDINHRTPVVLISGYGEIETVVAALKAGAENFLTKPLKMEKLYKVLRQSLDLGCAHAESCTNQIRCRQTTIMDSPSQPHLIRELIYQISLSSVAAGFSVRDLDNNLKLAFSEAITNAMEHGNKWDPGKFIRVKVVAGRGILEVDIRDEGPGFDSASLPDPTDESNLYNERGRGVFLMYTIMDKVKFSPEGNRVVLTKFASDLKAGADGRQDGIAGF